VDFLSGLALSLLNLSKLEKGGIGLNKIIQRLVNVVVRIEVSGKIYISGRLIELGSDTLVLFDGKDYYYMPLVHIQKIEVDDNHERDIEIPADSPSITSEYDNDEMSLRKVLTQAKGEFVEIYVTAGKPLHGYITSIMNNYFVFHSPIYKTMYIAIKHLKWLIPYTNSQPPYGLENQNFPMPVIYTSLARTFEVQIEKFKNKIVIFNVGESTNHIGKINNIEEQIVELQTARDQPIMINLQHIKTLHMV
jgi:hypothetical protein